MEKSSAENGDNPLAPTVAEDELVVSIVVELGGTGTATSSVAKKYPHQTGCELLFPARGACRRSDRRCVPRCALGPPESAPRSELLERTFVERQSQTRGKALLTPHGGAPRKQLFTRARQKVWPWFQARHKKHSHWPMLGLQSDELEPKLLLFDAARCAARCDVLQNTRTDQQLPEKEEKTGCMANIIKLSQHFHASPPQTDRVTLSLKNQLRLRRKEGIARHELRASTRWDGNRPWRCLRNAFACVTARNASSASCCMTSACSIGSTINAKWHVFPI